MVKTTKETNNSNVLEEKEEDTDITEGMDKTMRFLMPYHRYIMIGGIIILIMLVVFLGFAYGGLKVCRDLDGLLDDRFQCHPNYKPQMIGSGRQPEIIILNTSPLFRK